MKYPRRFNGMKKRRFMNKVDALLVLSSKFTEASKDAIWHINIDADMFTPEAREYIELYNKEHGHHPDVSDLLVFVGGKAADLFIGESR